MTIIYETPRSDVSTENDILINRPSNIVKCLLIVFTILSCSLSFILQFLKTGLVGSGVGGIIASIFCGALIVGIFQIGRSFRNSSSRCKVFLWSQVIYSFSGLFNLLMFLGESVNA